MKDTFSGYHPIINFCYFTTVMLVTMLVMHPVFLAISFVSATAYSIYLNGSKAVKFSLFGMLPIMIIMAVINPLFNHAGVTIIAYMKKGNPITLESICYGIAAACMFCAVIVWFSCFNCVMTSDKFVYLFGRIIPALSLILSMSLRFVPRFKTHIKQVANAQKCIGRDIKSGSIIKRASCGIRILSITITWALESSVITSDSMRSRGYGLKGRTAYSIFRWEKRDIHLVATLGVCFVAFLITLFQGGIFIRYFPSIRINQINSAAIIGYLCYGIFCMTPMIINIKEDALWRSLKSKI